MIVTLVAPPLLLAIVVLAALGSCSTDGPDDGATTGPDAGGAWEWPSSADDFCAATAPRWCTTIAPCCNVPASSFGEASGFERAGCEEEFVFQCERQMEMVQAGARTFSPARLRECLEALAPLLGSCELSAKDFAELERARQPCARVFNGTLDEGATCAAELESPEPPFELSGGPCRQPNDLGLMATCTTPFLTGEARCETHALLSPGDACRHGDDCGFGATCSAPAPCPDGCGVADAGPLSLPCPPDCVPAGTSSTGSCESRLGEPCDDDTGATGPFTAFVDEGLVCVDGIVTAGGGPGAACQSAEDCQDACIGPSGSSTCEEGDRRCTCSGVDRLGFIDAVDCGVELRCGTTICNAAFYVPCCTEDDRCGARVEGLVSSCVAPESPGVPDPVCPDEVGVQLSPMLPDQLTGCCRADGSCGLSSFATPRLGCVPRETLGYAAHACTPPSCGDTVCIRDEPIAGPTAHCCTTEGACGLQNERVSGECFDADQPGSPTFLECPPRDFVGLDSCCRPDGHCGLLYSPYTCIALTDAGFADAPCTPPEAP